MKSAKQALLDAGRIEKIGRGRISLDNHAWLRDQYIAGVRFTDYVPKDVTVSDKPEAAAPKPGNAQSVTTVKNLSQVYIRYPEGRYVVHETLSGKARSMREACNGCGLSLIGHTCDSPAIVSTDGRQSVAVTIKGVKSSTQTT